MGHRTLALLAAFIAACGLSVTGLDATSSSSSSSGGSSSGGDGGSIDTTTEGGAGDDDDGVVAETDDAGGNDNTPLFDGGGATVDAGGVSCNPTATIFWDSDDGNKDSATGLQAAMKANNQFTDVELGGAITAYNGGGGAADPHGKGVVIILTGHAYDITMPAAGQQAIADQLAKNGVGLVTSEWFPVIFDNTTDALAPFSLVTSNHEIDYGSKAKVVFTDTTFWAGTGASNNFTTAANVPLHYESARANVATNASASFNFGQGSESRPIVFSASLGATRVAHTTFAINYPQPSGRDHIGGPTGPPPPPPPDDSLDKDANMKTMFVNMAQWAAHCRD